MDLNKSTKEWRKELTDAAINMPDFSSTFYLLNDGNVLMISRMSDNYEMENRNSSPSNSCDISNILTRRLTLFECNDKVDNMWHSEINGKYAEFVGNKWEYPCRSNQGFKSIPGNELIDIGIVTNASVVECLGTREMWGGTLDDRTPSTVVKEMTDIAKAAFKDYLKTNPSIAFSESHVNKAKKIFEHTDFDETCYGAGGFILNDGTFLHLPDGEDFDVIKKCFNTQEAEYIDTDMAIQTFISEGNVQWDGFTGALVVNKGTPLTDEQEQCIAKLAKEGELLYLDVLTDKGAHHFDYFKDASLENVLKDIKGVDKNVQNKGLDPR